MGKSIRSKIKRMHRAEFRRTIGTEAYDQQMEKVTTILHSTIDKQTLKSLDKLVDAFDTTMEDTNSNEQQQQQQSMTSSYGKTKINENIGIYESVPEQQHQQQERKEEDAVVTNTKGRNSIIGAGGENKVIVSKKSKRKQKHGYRMKAIISTNNKEKGIDTMSTTTTTKQQRVKARPKFFCSF